MIINSDGLSSLNGVDSAKLAETDPRKLAVKGVLTGNEGRMANPLSGASEFAGNDEDFSIGGVQASDFDGNTGAEQDVDEGKSLSESLGFAGAQLDAVRDEREKEDELPRLPPSQCARIYLNYHENPTLESAMMFNWAWLETVNNRAMTAIEVQDAVRSGAFGGATHEEVAKKNAKTLGDTFYNLQKIRDYEQGNLTEERWHEFLRAFKKDAKKVGVDEATANTIYQFPREGQVQVAQAFALTNEETRKVLILAQAPLTLRQKALAMELTAIPKADVSEASFHGTLDTLSKRYSDLSNREIASSVAWATALIPESDRGFWNSLWRNVQIRQEDTVNKFLFALGAGDTAEFYGYTSEGDVPEQIGEAWLKRMGWVPDVPANHLLAKTEKKSGERRKKPNEREHTAGMAHIRDVIREANERGANIPLTYRDDTKLDEESKKILADVVREHVGKNMKVQAQLQRQALMTDLYAAKFADFGSVGNKAINGASDLMMGAELLAVGALCAPLGAVAATALTFGTATLLYAPSSYSERFVSVYGQGASYSDARAAGLLSAGNEVIGDSLVSFAVVKGVTPVLSLMAKTRFGRKVAMASFGTQRTTRIVNKGTSRDVPLWLVVSMGAARFGENVAMETSTEIAQDWFHNIIDAYYSPTQEVHVGGAFVEALGGTWDILAVTAPLSALGMGAAHVQTTNRLNKLIPADLKGEAREQAMKEAVSNLVTWEGARVLGKYSNKKWGLSDNPDLDAQSVVNKIFSATNEKGEKYSADWSMDQKKEFVGRVLGEKKVSDMLIRHIDTVDAAAKLSNTRRERANAVAQRVDDVLARAVAEEESAGKEEQKAQTEGGEDSRKSTVPAGSEQTPAEQTPAEQAPAEQAPVEQAPVEQAPQSEDTVQASEDEHSSDEEVPAKKDEAAERSVDLKSAVETFFAYLEQRSKEGFKYNAEADIRAEVEYVFFGKEPEKGVELDALVVEALKKIKERAGNGYQLKMFLDAYYAQADTSLSNATSGETKAARIATIGAIYTGDSSLSNWETYVRNRWIDSTISVNAKRIGTYSESQRKAVIEAIQKLLPGYTIVLQRNGEKAPSWVPITSGGDIGYVSLSEKKMWISSKASLRTIVHEVFHTTVASLRERAKSGDKLAQAQLSKLTEYMRSVPRAILEVVYRDVEQSHTGSRKFADGVGSNVDVWELLDEIGARVFEREHTADFESAIRRNGTWWGKVAKAIRGLFSSHGNADDGAKLAREDARTVVNRLTGQILAGEVAIGEDKAASRRKSTIDDDDDYSGDYEEPASLDEAYKVPLPTSWGDTAGDNALIAKTEDLLEKELEEELSKALAVRVGQAVRASDGGRLRVRYRDVIPPLVLAAIKREMRGIIDTAIRNGTWLKAPNGKPSLLNPHQWVLARTKNFKKWFGDWERDRKHASVVLDINKEPAVVVHNTRTKAGFTKHEAFSGMIWTAGGNHPIDLLRRYEGKYHPPMSAETAWTGNVTSQLPVSLSFFCKILKPYKYNARGRKWHSLPNGETTDSLVDEVLNEKSKGPDIDGVIIKDVDEGFVAKDAKNGERTPITDIIVPDVSQLKSADWNAGLFGVIDEVLPEILRGDHRFCTIGMLGLRRLARYYKSDLAADIKDAAHNFFVFGSAPYWVLGPDGILRGILQTPVWDFFKKKENYQKILDRGYTSTLGALLGKEDDLFIAYPELAKLPISFRKKDSSYRYGATSVSPTGELKKITLCCSHEEADAAGKTVVVTHSQESLARTLEHEIQHCIQKIENFPSKGVANIGIKSPSLELVFLACFWEPYVYKRPIKDTLLQFLKLVQKLHAQKVPENSPFRDGYLVRDAYRAEKIIQTFINLCPTLTSAIKSLEAYVKDAARTDAGLRYELNAGEIEAEAVAQQVTKRSPQVDLTAEHPADWQMVEPAGMVQADPFLSHSYLKQNAKELRAEYYAHAAQVLRNENDGAFVDENPDLFGNVTSRKSTVGSGGDFNINSDMQMNAWAVRWAKRALVQGNWSAPGVMPEELKKENAGIRSLVRAKARAIVKIALKGNELSAERAIRDEKEAMKAVTDAYKLLMFENIMQTAYDEIVHGAQTEKGAKAKVSDVYKQAETSDERREEVSKIAARAEIDFAGISARKGEEMSQEASRQARRNLRGKADKVAYELADMMSILGTTFEKQLELIKKNAGNRVYERLQALSRMGVFDDIEAFLRRADEDEDVEREYLSAMTVLIEYRENADLLKQIAGSTEETYIKRLQARLDDAAEALQGAADVYNASKLPESTETSIGNVLMSILTDLAGLNINRDRKSGQWWIKHVETDKWGEHGFVGFEAEILKYPEAEREVLKQFKATVVHIIAAQKAKGRLSAMQRAIDELNGAITLKDAYFAAMHALSLTAGEFSSYYRPMAEQRLTSLVLSFPKKVDERTSQESATYTSDWVLFSAIVREVYQQFRASDFVSVEDEIEKLEGKLGENDGANDEEIRARIRALQLIGGADYFSTERLNYVFQQLKYDRDAAFVGKQREDFQRRHEIKSDIAPFLEALKSNRDQTQKENQGVLSKAGEVIGNTLAGLFSVKQRLQGMIKHAKAATYTSASQFIDLWTDMIDAATFRHEQLVEENRKWWHDTLVSLWGSEAKAARAIARAGVRLPELSKFNHRTDVGDGTLAISPLHALHIYMSSIQRSFEAALDHAELFSSNPNAAALIAQRKAYLAQREELREWLANYEGGILLKLADKVQERWAQLRPQINEAYRMVFGFDMYDPYHETNYYPLRFLGAEKHGISNPSSQDVILPVSRRFQARTVNINELDTHIDFLRAVTEQMQTELHTIAFVAAHLYTERILKDSDFTRVLNARVNQGARDALNRHLGDVFALPAQLEKAASEWSVWSALSKASALTALAFSPFSLVRQALSGGTYLNLMSAKDWMRAVMRPITNPVLYMSALKRVFGDDRVRSRYTVPAKFIQEAVLRGEGNIGRLFRKVQNLAMLNIQFGDAVPLLTIGVGVYIAAYERNLNMGMNEDEAHDKAIEEMMSLSEQTQQTRRMMNQNAFQRSNNAAIRSVAQFRSAQDQVAGIELRRLSDFFADPLNPDKAGKALKTVIANHLLFAAFTDFIIQLIFWALADDDDDDDVKTVDWEELATAFALGGAWGSTGVALVGGTYALTEQGQGRSTVLNTVPSVSVLTQTINQLIKAGKITKKQLIKRSDIPEDSPFWREDVSETDVALIIREWGKATGIGRALDRILGPKSRLGNALFEEGDVRDEESVFR